MASRSPGLVTHSRILVSTRNGEREIQLCLGDITRLSMDEKVDVILVSAYPSNSLIIMHTIRITELCSF